MGAPCGVEAMVWKTAMKWTKTSKTEILFDYFLMHPPTFWFPCRQDVWSLTLRHRTDLTYDSFRWQSSGDGEIRERQSRLPKYRLVSASHRWGRDSRWAHAVPRLLPLPSNYLYSRSNLAWKSRTQSSSNRNAAVEVNLVQSRFGGT